MATCCVIALELRIDFLATDLAALSKAINEVPTEICIDN
jgi:hypothetical protein